MTRSQLLSRAGIATAAVIGLAACGTAVSGGSAGSGGSASASAPGSGSAAATPGGPASPPPAVPVGAASVVCANASRITTLTVRRSDSLPRNHMHFTFPAVTTVGDTAKARGVAEAMCSLPQMPRVMITCPADLGITYRLIFSSAGRSYPAVIAEPGGCRKLVGLDSTRQAVPKFWVTLGKAMGIAHPGSSSLNGTLS
jgi:hypothetical protein